MDYIIEHIPKDPKKRTGKKVNMTTITIHSTANPKSTALNERNWLLNPSNGRSASWHIAVDEHMCVEAIPLNEQAYHSGNSIGNNTSIGIEICESGNRNKTIQNAVELVSKMLQERGWGVDRLRRHYDWSKKICPRIMYDGGSWKGWNDFKSKVQKELNKVNKPQEVSNWAKKDWDWATKEKFIDGTRPKDSVTREEMTIIIKRLVDRLG